MSLFTDLIGALAEGLVEEIEIDIEVERIMRREDRRRGHDLSDLIDSIDHSRRCHHRHRCGCDLDCDTTLSDKEVRELKRDMRRMVFDSERTHVMERIMRNRMIRAEDAAEVVSRFTFSDAKTEAALFLIPRVVDMRNISRLVRTVGFFDRDKVRRAADREMGRY